VCVCVSVCKCESASLNERQTRFTIIPHLSINKRDSNPVIQEKRTTFASIVVNLLRKNKITQQ